MDRAKQRKISRDRIRVRIRTKLTGTSERPRLAVKKSLKHIYVQIIDDASGKTIASASSRDKDSGVKGGSNQAAAKAVGALIAKKAKDKGVKRVVFDRGGYQYHGNIKALADAARENGLEF
jgi:large subunit ribosomal protein L18